MAHGGARWQVSHRQFAVDVRKFSHSSPCSSSGRNGPNQVVGSSRLMRAGALSHLRSRARAISSGSSTALKPPSGEMGPKRRWGGTRQVVWQVGIWDPEGGNQRDWGWDSPGGSAPRHALAGWRTGSRAVRNPARRLSPSFPLSFLKRYFRDRESSMNESLNATGFACWRIARAIGRIFRKLACSAQTHDMRTRWLELEATAMSIAEFWIRQVRYIPDSPACRAVNRVAIGRLHRSVASYWGLRKL